MVKSRGFSMLETSIVACLILILLVGVQVFFAYAQRYSQHTQAYASAQKEAVAIARSLTEELSNSVDRWVIYGPDWIRFLSPSTPDTMKDQVEFDMASGLLIWKKWVCYYYDPAAKTVVRSEIALTSPTSQLTTEPTPAAMLTDFQINPGRSKRVIGRQVEKFQIAAHGPATYDMTIETSALAAVAASTDAEKKALQTLRSRVTLLNHLP